jgi:hypothetical protein
MDTTGRTVSAPELIRLSATQAGITLTDDEIQNLLHGSTVTLKECPAGLCEGERLLEAIGFRPSDPDFKELTRCKKISLSHRRIGDLGAMLIRMDALMMQSGENENVLIGDLVTKAKRIGDEGEPHEEPEPDVAALTKCATTTTHKGPLTVRAKCCVTITLKGASMECTVTISVKV